MFLDPIVKWFSLIDELGEFYQTIMCDVDLVNNEVIQFGRLSSTSIVWLLSAFIARIKRDGGRTACDSSLYYF